MAVKGRKPKPTHLKLLMGNPGGRPLPANEPKPVVEAVTAPAHLTAIAQAEWRRLLPELLAVGLVSKLDRAALAAYCVAYGRWVEAEEVVAKLGPITKAPKTGVPMHNPFLAVANAAMAQMDRFGAKFGLSPQDRARLEMKGDDGAADDPASRYLA